VNGQKTIAVDGIEAVLIRKNVKSIRVTIVPPDGEVRVSAPRFCPELLIRGFLAERADWIRAHVAAVRSRHANEPKRFETGETVPLFGTSYRLTVLENQKKNAVALDGDQILLSLKTSAAPEQREAILNDWYRERLKTEIEYLLPLWEERTGLKSSGWIVRNMTSRWGTCNTNSGRITLNLQLVKYPLPCLEYVILHELAHLRYRGHGADFKAFLSAHMPSWKARRKQLNG
jgi:predicted metal-dependent hydrolase